MGCDTEWIAKTDDPVAELFAHCDACPKLHGWHARVRRLRNRLSRWVAA